jgi:hypothetical protein
MEILDGIESDPTPEAIQFIERAWRARGATDLKVGMMLAGAWDKLHEPKRASSVLVTLAESTPSAGSELLVKIINRLVKLESPKVALRLSPLVKKDMRTPPLQRAWARVITAAKDREEAVEFLGRSDVDPAPFASRPSLWFELLALAGREDEVPTAADVFTGRLAVLLQTEGLDTRNEVALKQLYAVMSPGGRETLLRMAHNSLSSKPSDLFKLVRLEERLRRRVKDLDKDDE